ncbi:MAG TPA: alpha/beta hydrolase [Aggregatilineales bacterium]|nr:alpha/beta hydrolase [Aggregatilineales bacterium]HPV07596.1 alpha/beta hydrolase [Aggregatilineales bacterium]HQA66914.1 alpha/beta hydrolase [Aggregatilineales bacterium]HQE16884.1 alpha/beta hydrolase [Aggregatilineales bacterium]
MSIAIALGVLLVVLLGFRLATALIVRRAESAYPPAGQFVDVDGWRQHVLVEGEGPPVVLIHGDGGSIYDFTLSPLYPCLTARYRTFTVDRPGFGYSRRPVHGGGSPLVQASLIHDALAALGVEKPVVVGHARGAAVALAYALAYPNDLAAIVALAPAAYTHSEGTLIARLATMSALDRLLVLTVYTPAARFNNYALVRPILDNAFAPDMPTPPDYLRAYGAMWARPHHIRATMRDRRFSVVDLQGDRYGEIEVPVVIVQGEADRRVSPADAARLHGDLARSELVLIPDTGHALMFTQPDAVLKAIERAWEMAGENAAGV